MRGVVLTHTNDLALLMQKMAAADLGVVKIVTAWPEWNADSMRLVARAPALIVRSVTGDGIKPPDPNALRSELRSWYSLRPDLFVEIGNEPNAVEGFTEKMIWAWKYNLNACITMVRDEFPRAEIISPGLLTGNRIDRWFAIAGDAFNRCDYIGIHAYEWYNFTPGGTFQLRTALQYARRMAKPAFITELGINDIGTSPETKARRYRATVATLPGFVAGTVVYHICDRPINEDQSAYALTLDAVQYLR